MYCHISNCTTVKKCNVFCVELTLPTITASDHVSTQQFLKVAIFLFDSQITELLSRDNLGIPQISTRERERIHQTQALIQPRLSINDHPLSVSFVCSSIDFRLSHSLYITALTASLMTVTSCCFSFCASLMAVNNYLLLDARHERERCKDKLMME